MVSMKIDEILVGYELRELDGGKYLYYEAYIDGEKRVVWKFNPFPLQTALEWIVESLVKDSKRGILIVDGVGINYAMRRVIKKGGGEENYLAFYTEFEGKSGGGARYDFSDLGKCLKDIARMAREGELIKRR